MPFTPVFREVPKNALEWGRYLRSIRNENGTVSNAELRDSAALSVIGRASNSTGSPADITSAANDTFLVRRSNALTWGPIQASDITADMITQHMAAIRSFLPRPVPPVDEFQLLMASRVFGRR